MSRKRQTIRRDKEPEMMYISRIDSGRNHSWFVRVVNPETGEVVSDTYSDGKYGGKDNALEWAQGFRDILVEMLRPSQRYYCNHDKRNTWGQVGVNRSVRTRFIQRIDGGETMIEEQTWHCRWSENGKNYHRSWSVRKWGEKEAERRARECRKAAVKRLDEQFNLGY